MHSVLFDLFISDPMQQSDVLLFEEKRCGFIFL